MCSSDLYGHLETTTWHDAVVGTAHQSVAHTRQHVSDRIGHHGCKSPTTRPSALQESLPAARVNGNNTGKCQICGSTPGGVRRVGSGCIAELRTSAFAAALPSSTSWPYQYAFGWFRVFATSSCPTLSGRAFRAASAARSLPCR